MHDITRARPGREPDFRALFDLAPSPYLVLSPEFVIVEVNAAYLRATGTVREQILQRGMFDAFPDNPGDPAANGSAMLRASLVRALASRQPDAMPVQRYDIQGRGPDFVERYWKALNTPLLDGEGKVTHLVHHVEDVTQAVQAANAARAMQSELSSQARELHDHRHFAELFQQAPTFMAMLAGPQHRVEFANPELLKLIGERDIIGKIFADALPDALAQGYTALLDQVYHTGVAFSAQGSRYTVRAAPGAPPDERYVDFVYQPIRHQDGSARGVFVQGVDVTQRVLHELRRDVLARLTDVIGANDGPDDIIFAASEILGETLQVSRVGYGTIDPVAETLTVARDWNAPGVATLAGTLHLREYGSFIDDLKQGRFIAIDDVACDPRTASAAGALRQRSAGAFVNLPVLEHGKLVAVIFVNNACARRWSADELALIREVAERARGASERVRIEVEVRLSEAKFRTIADAMPQMVWSTRADGFHDYYNQQWYDFTGMPSGSTDGDAWSGMFHPDDQAQAWERWRHSLQTGQTYEVEYRLRHCGGEYRWVLGRALPIRDDAGAIVRWMGTCTDIHAQKLAEDELRAASRRKDDFLAMLAHELRNPLAPISTAAQLIKLPGASAKRISQASDIISRQVRHMTDLVDDLLDVSRVTRGLVQLDNAELNVKTVINGALEQARPLLEARHHQLALHITPELAHVRGDRTRLIQAIANLLNNAAKYTPQHGHITLTLEVRQRQVTVSVRDNGIGIPPGLLPHVFDLFTQAERTPDRAQGGLGLGLALVKSIAGLHGGSVAAVSAGTGQGSTFTIALPLADPAAAQADVALAGPDAPARALSVMVVDDNGDAALSLASLLEAGGHRVAVFDSAEAALQASAIETIDAFIFDIGLPDIDGYELTRRMRATPGIAAKLLIALTGYGQAHDRVLSKAAGFDHHLVKPVDMAQLNRILAGVASG